MNRSFVFRDGPLSVHALKVRQPVGDFYQAVIPWGLLIEISRADVRAMENGDERTLDRYIGIQRKLDKKREKDIASYVNLIGATFPTSIVLAIDEDNVEWDEARNLLTFMDGKGDGIDKIAKILDGQHRVEGLKAFRGSEDEFDLP